MPKPKPQGKDLNWQLADAQQAERQLENSDTQDTVIV